MDCPQFPPDTADWPLSFQGHLGWRVALGLHIFCGLDHRSRRKILIGYKCAIKPLFFCCYKGFLAYNCVGIQVFLLKNNHEISEKSQMDFFWGESVFGRGESHPEKYHSVEKGGWFFLTSPQLNHARRFKTIFSTHEDIVLLVSSSKKTHSYYLWNLPLILMELPFIIYCPAMESPSCGLSLCHNHLFLVAFHQIYSITQMLTCVHGCEDSGTYVWQQLQWYCNIMLSCCDTLLSVLNFTQIVCTVALGKWLCVWVVMFHSFQTKNTKQRKQMSLGTLHSP